MNGGESNWFSVSIFAYLPVVSVTCLLLCGTLSQQQGGYFSPLAATSHA